MVKNIDHIQCQNDLELLYQFPVQQINLIEAFIKEHPSIESIFFIDWPGLKLDHLIHLKRIAEEKMINLTYRCYTH
mgnify:CR=1 FL=1